MHLVILSCTVPDTGFDSESEPKSLELNKIFVAG